MNEETEAQRGDTILPGLHNQEYLTKSVCGHSAVMPKGVGTEAQRRGCQPGCLGWDPHVRAQDAPIWLHLRHTTQQLLAVRSGRARTVVKSRASPGRWKEELSANDE